MTTGELVEVVSIVPGDEIRVAGEWLDVMDVRRVNRARAVLIRCDNEPGLEPRAFLADPFARRRVRRHAPIKPTVSV